MVMKDLWLHCTHLKMDFLSILQGFIMSMVGYGFKVSLRMSFEKHCGIAYSVDQKVLQYFNKDRVVQ